LEPASWLKLVDSSLLEPEGWLKLGGSSLLEPEGWLKLNGWLEACWSFASAGTGAF